MGFPFFLAQAPALATGDRAAPKLAAGAAASADMTDGEVRKVDMEGGTPMKRHRPTIRALAAVAAAKDTLATQVEQDYCWTWRNKSAVAATVKVNLQR